MAYGLHIEREEPIELEEWRSAVAANVNLRLEEEDSTSTNPVTGEEITVRGQAGTAAIGINGQWGKAFRWRKGKVSFNAPASTSTKDPTMAVALQLASTLSAVICGDEGELYDGSL